MLLVVLHGPPMTPPMVAAVAGATDLAAADVRQRLAGPGPWALAVAAESEGLQTQANRLQRLGLRALVCDPSLVPEDGERIVARSLALLPTHLQITDASEQVHACPYSAIALIQAGNRAHTTAKTTETTERRISVGRALLTGGLSLTKKETVRVNTTVHSDERFVHLSRNDGGPDVMLYERRLNYKFLGDQLQPSSFANLQKVMAWLRERTGALVDERVATAGFSNRLPKVGVSPVDLALYLVQLATLAG